LACAATVVDCSDAPQTYAAHIRQAIAEVTNKRITHLIYSHFHADHGRRHFVGHNAMDHTAILHFVEERFNLPALTKRDAAQPNLLDFFDFAGKPWATPPTGIPVPPEVGTTCHPATMH
jgi:hypothetical protein